MENLGIDAKLLLAQLINFGLFFYIFKRYISGPFQLFMKNEAKKEGEKERLLKDAKNNEELLAKKQEELAENNKKLKAEILVKAKDEAKNIKDQLMADAKKEIDNLRESAKKSIQLEKEKVQAEIEKRVVELTKLLINSTLKNYISEDVSRQLTESMLKSLSKELSRYEN